MVQRAQTLDDALDVLELQPLDFRSGDPSPASDPAFYVPQPAPAGSGKLQRTDPEQRLAQRLLAQRTPAAVFLAGHVGSGKSTLINKLAAEEEIKRAFSVMPLRLETDLIPFLDSMQLLFFISEVVYNTGITQKLFTAEAKWREVLGHIDTRIFGDTGVTLKEAAVGGELSALFAKVRTDLKFMPSRRQLFRDLGETQRTAMLDLIKYMTLDILRCLQASGKSATPLLLVDDLDKARGAEQQKDIFDTNLPSLLALPFHVLYTLPSGVAFGPNRVEVRSSHVHLYPVRVLRKAPDKFNPEEAFVEKSDRFFREVVDHRVEPKLFTDGAVKVAAIYAGGVLREFFRILRGAVELARFNKLAEVDEYAVREAVVDERRSETMALYAPDYEALRAVHATNTMGKIEDRRYLDESRVLECYNGETWYEVHPILWKVLAPKG